MFLLENKEVSWLALTIAAFASFPGTAEAQEAAVNSIIPVATDDEIIVTGTRTASRSSRQTTAPVDVVSSATLNSGGVTELNQALSTALPSYNFPRPGLSDGTDTIRPATLRGLAPDQTLVLVNSRRRHSSSLVNVNGTIGRGSAAVDMNAIPTAAIRSVQVLRDGASAQYGSDAIAGVINVLPREASSGGGLNFTYGQRITTVDTLVDDAPDGANWSVDDLASRKARDGETIMASGWIGLPLGDEGFLTLTAEYLDQNKTVRTAPDWRQNYPLVDGAFDAREAEFNRLDAWYGEPDIVQYTLFANAGYDLANGVELYSWASYQDREALSAGYFRRALDDRNVIEIYPDGFLPLINPKVSDYSAAFGARWAWSDWEMDSSLVYGANAMRFTIENTLNRSYGVESKTVFDSGGFDYGQLVFNLGGTRGYEVGLSSPLNVSVGLEARRESYSITAGEPESYLNGGVLLDGAPTASGAQVFPGFRPENAIDENRESIGAYIDLEANITDSLLASAAARVESYSDFGETVTGKLAARYDFADWFALRASIQNGFRAPSLQQQYFTATSTNFIDGVAYDITTFPATDPVAEALGAKPLEAEKSVNYAIGAVLRVADLDVTVDVYRIEIDNRVVLSENLTSTAVREYLETQGFTGIGGGRFFINGVDTVTEGVDIVTSYSWDADVIGQFKFFLGANFNTTDVTEVPQTQELAALDPAPSLFDRINILTFEKGAPKNKFNLTTNWDLGRLGAMVRATRYGEALSPGTSEANDLTLEPRVLLDIEAHINLTDAAVFSIGADNVTDQYPTQTPPNLNTTSNTPFSNYSPFGRSGRYVYGRLSYSW